jgi:hypothetical protein
MIKSETVTHIWVPGSGEESIIYINSKMLLFSLTLWVHMSQSTPPSHPQVAGNGVAGWFAMSFCSHRDRTILIIYSESSFCDSSNDTRVSYLHMCLGLLWAGQFISKAIQRRFCHFLTP